MKKKMVGLLSLVLVTCILLSACGSCKTCYGVGEISCTNSKCSDGKLRCDVCDGMNRINIEDCSSCKVGYEIVKCPKCDGKGKITNPFTWEQFTCGMCGGAMCVEEYCEYCDGEGYTYDECTKCQYGSVGECPTCKGEGMIDCPDC